jgi:hypothetical protein
VDNKATPQNVREAKGCDSHGCLTFFNALWFMIVTVSSLDAQSNWTATVVHAYKKVVNNVIEINQNCITNFGQKNHVQISTVGYGDITPSSDWGRLVVLCVIIGALVILPPQINRILRLASRRYAQTNLSNCIIALFILFYIGCT